MPKSLMLVFTNPASSAQEKEYNRWYTEKHILDVARVNGAVAATRYKLEKSVPSPGGMGTDSRRYLAIYELEAKTAAELQKFTDDLNAAMMRGEVDVSPALDMIDGMVCFAIPISERATG